jgi:hypothetical protein
MERRAELARGRYAKKVALKKRREKCTKFDIKQKRALKKPFVKEDNWWCRVEGCERFFDTAQKSYQHKSRVHRGFFEKRFEVFCDSD